MKKSLYLFLTSMMGMLLFVILHRIAAFMYLDFWMPQGFSAASGDIYYRFMAVDYFTLMLVMLAGVWYGIWVGLEWYEKVYGGGFPRGLVDHLASCCWPPSSGGISWEARGEEARSRLEQNLADLEERVKKAPFEPRQPSAIKRQAVRKKAPAARIPRKKTASKPAGYIEQK